MPRKVSRLLIQESPLQVLPSLARAIGLNEAIFLQQVHYLLGISKNEREGRLWTYRTLAKWRVEYFPFWSEATIKRTVARLRSLGVLVVGEFNKARGDRTSWYSIDYEAVERLRLGASDQVDPTHEVKSSRSPYQKTTDHENTDVIVVRPGHEGPADGPAGRRDLDEILQPALELFRTKDASPESQWAVRRKLAGFLSSCSDPPNVVMAALMPRFEKASRKRWDEDGEAGVGYMLNVLDQPDVRDEVGYGPPAQT